MSKILMQEVLNILRPKQLHNRPQFVYMLYKTANLYVFASPTSRGAVMNGLRSAANYFHLTLDGKESIQGLQLQQEIQTIFDGATGLSAKGRDYVDLDDVNAQIRLRPMNFVPVDVAVRTKRETARGQRLVRAASALKGSFSWGGPSGPDTAADYTIKTQNERNRIRPNDFLGVGYDETTTNAFAQLMKRVQRFNDLQKQEIQSKTAVGGATVMGADYQDQTDLDALVHNRQATFNCWESVFVCAAHAGLVTLRQLQQIHDKAARMAQASSTDKYNAYIGVLKNALELRDPETFTNVNQPMEGDILFFNGMEHVAIADGNGDMYSLYNRDAWGAPRYDVTLPFMQVPIQSISGSGKFSPCPF